MMPANRRGDVPTLDGVPALRSSTEWSHAIAFEGRLGRAYNEGPFRHLFALEQAQADRFRRSLLLVVVSISTEAGDDLPFPPRTATRLFDALWLCTRDVDLTGWYTQDRIAAAVLIQDATMPAGPDIARIQSRIEAALRGRLHSGSVSGLRVRVLQVGASHGGDTERRGHLPSSGAPLPPS